MEVCVFAGENRRPKFLILKRAPDEKIYPGLWQFVSGAIETGEKAVDAALRELHEETGFVPEAFWNVPFVNSFYDHLQDAVHLSPVFAAEVKQVQDPKLSFEHETWEWLEFPEALERLAWPGQRAALKVVLEHIVGGTEASVRTRLR